MGITPAATIWAQQCIIINDPEPPPADPSKPYRHTECPGARMDGLDLKKADLSYANLAGAKFGEMVLDHTIFKRANLSGADMHNVIFKDVFLGAANMQFANLAGASMEDQGITTFLDTPIPFKLRDYFNLANHVNVSGTQLMPPDGVQVAVLPMARRSEGEFGVSGIRLVQQLTRHLPGPIPGTRLAACYLGSQKPQQLGRPIVWLEPARNPYYVHCTVNLIKQGRGSGEAYDFAWGELHVFVKRSGGGGAS
jgi:hypothetical protein